MHKLYDEDEAHSAEGLFEPGETAQGSASPALLRHFTLTAEHAGTRLDKVLGTLIPEHSRHFLQQLLEAGAVTHNGQTAVKSSVRARAGDTLSIALTHPASEQVWQAEHIAIDWRHRDEHLGVLHKPAGWVVHPAAGNWSGTLLHALLGDAPVAAQLPRAGIVHRLDKGTSGLMLVGRSLPACDALVRLMAERSIQREYLALVQGAWNKGECLTLDAPMGRDPRNRLRMAVSACSSSAKPARTTFHLIERSTRYSLLHCRLHTGRTHQIRVHTKHLGFPIVGDTLYGGAFLPSMLRPALHAFRLQLAHPMTQAPLSFVAALPQDFLDSLHAVGLRCPELEKLFAG